MGGFGLVFLARDPLLNRSVALKVPRPDLPLTDVLRRRFVQEGRAAAALNHPHIVPVFETGWAGSIPYIAAAYCPGPTLAEYLRDRPPLPPRAAARLGAILADALQHAHDRGVLHRDLKPSNVLLQQRGEGGGHADGATDLLVELYGERGKPTRAAIGCQGLALGHSVEIVLTVMFSGGEVRPPLHRDAHAR